MTYDIEQASYITALDLTKGYWKVPVVKASQEKTYLRLTLGKVPVWDHPLWFGLIDQLLDGTPTFAVAYLDEVIIHCRCWKEHLEHLREILTRLRKARLTIKESKCKFTRSKCGYPGHTLGNGKVHPLLA